LGASVAASVISAPGSRRRGRQDILARYATAPGGRLRQAIYFHDGDITAIA
jgi:hypothetical protein